MSSDRGSPRHHLRRQSIPLQDLSRPPDTPSEDDGGGNRRSFESWSRGSLLGNRQRFSGSVNTGRYERVVEGSPDRTAPNAPHVTTPRNVHQPVPYDDGEVSPVNPGDFQAAMGSVGLSFENPGPPHSRPPAPSTLVSGRSRRESTLNVITETDAATPFAAPLTRADTEENYFSPTDNDMTPLADTRFLQPISGAPASASSGSRHDRSTSRLGDDLNNPEAGLRPPSTYSARSMSRSLSVSGTASPLSRAGTMMRKMSQRVVNLSNEPEIVEQSIRRQPSRDARLEAPPSFPEYVDYGNAEPGSSSAPFEKSRPLIVAVGQEPDDWKQHPNPLKGKSLGIFPPDSWIRLRLCEMLVHPVTEPIILMLIFIQTILLAVDSAPKIGDGDRPKGWGDTWIDFALLILFIIYTAEIIVRVIVSGFVKNAPEYSTVDWDLGIKRALLDRCMNFFVPYRQQQMTGLKPMNPSDPAPSVIRTFTSTQAQTDQPGHTRQQQRVRLARRAFLRHGFNRLDFVAVVSFWISFGLELANIEHQRHVYVFRMLSCLRILRLLGLTSGTSVILRSLKRAAPLLVNVAFLIGFFWLLFAIIGVQSFKSSFKRSCVYFEDIENYSTNRSQTPYTLNDPNGVFQACGGYINATTGDRWPWLHADFTIGTDSHKGYLCPPQSLCLEGSNPYNGTVSFDNIAQSLQLVFVVMSSNTFSDLLYYTTDSDFLAAALFFAFGIVIMSLWLMNLLVAVITSSFQIIREESKTSAFTAEDEQIRLPDEEEEPEPVKKSGPLKRYYNKTYWLWIVIIVFDLVVQALRSADMSLSRENLINKTEMVVTLVLVFEICLRFLCDWRNFHISPRNWVDLGLAVITAIIQLPPVHRAKQVYAWFTFFQIVRIYRVVLAVSLTRQLILTVLGNVTGLLNLVVFVFLITFLTAIFAAQIFRGQFSSIDTSGSTVHVTFSDIYNSFIGMYQVLSSENWTILMYNSTSFEFTWHIAWIGATFFVLWFILANFIVLNMFIAVIQENFDVTEDEKRLEQVKAFLHQKELSGSSHGNLSLSTIFKFGRDPERHRDPLDYGPATMDMLTKDAVVRDFLDEQLEPVDDPNTDGVSKMDTMGTVKPGILSAIWGRLKRVLRQREANPFYSRLKFSRAYDELDPRTMAREVVSAQDQRKRAQRQYLQKHPNYNVSLFLFRPTNSIRRFCQRIVGPGRGSQRIEGVDPVKPVWYSFSAFIYTAIVAMVLLACISTPLYQKEYEQAHGPSTRNWFVWTDLGFAVIFTVEAIIKVVADGFFWTPNAYFRGSWGFIDGLVLVTLWINVAASLFSDGVVSRAVGAFKALRALRLLNVSDSARDTFHSVIILGGWKVVSAAFVSLSLLIPFAIYGLNLFNGQFQSCNDDSIDLLSNCIGEFSNTPYNWTVLSPRQVANPYYNFDDFGSSLSILFQIVSQEGWTDVMWSAMSAAGVGNNPQDFQSQGNAVFFIIFNLLGAVFVLTLFVSVFMRNYTEQTGVAFLTAEQRSWLELRKLLRQISPSKRPSQRSEQKWRLWCYRRAVKKHGKWQRFVTGILFLHLVLLILEFYPEPPWWELTRDYIFLAFTIIYISNIAIRIAGLTWTRFRRSSWDLYALLSVLGTIITTLLALAQPDNNHYRQLHKYFLVSIALLLIPRNNQLDQLFKTAAASLTAIANLLATWFVLFLVYAIALTQIFGLTRFGGQETGNLNFRNVPKALILLFRMSCGEGWNNIMEDFAKIVPPNCVYDADSFLNSDCGSAAWARTLFISWNILSMYIFVSLFVSLIFESFSYVYQRSSGMFVLSRNEIRRFKQAWATYDPDGTGYISKETFPRLLGELSGVFEMRIYKDEHTVYSILQDCKVEETRGSETPPPGVVHGIDLARLNDRLRTIDVDDVRQRRQRLELFYQEVMVHAPADRGINFTACLMILAHHNIISDNKSLRLEEFLRRRARLQRVMEEVNRRIVKGFFDTMFWSRQFRSRLDLRHSARMTMVPQFEVPEIFVDDQDVVSPQDGEFSPQFTSPPNVSAQYTSSPGMPPRETRGRRVSLDTGGLRRRSDSRGPSPAASDRSYSVSPQLSPHRPSLSVNRPSLSVRGPSHSGGSSGAGSSSGFQWTLDDTSDLGEARPAVRSRATSSVNKDVLQVFDESAWGESIRRSFTLGRNATRRRRGGSSSGGAS